MQPCKITIILNSIAVPYFQKLQYRQKRDSDRQAELGFKNAYSTIIKLTLE